METFKTDRKRYRHRELLRWAGTIITAGLIFVAITAFYSPKPDSLWISATVILLLKLRDMVLQFHVREISLDRDKGTINFTLSSLYSGQQVKIFELYQVNLSMRANSIFKRWLNDPETLIVHLPKKRSFFINGRYGFSPATLKSIEIQILTTGRQGATA